MNSVRSSRSAKPLDSSTTVTRSGSLGLVELHEPLGEQPPRLQQPGAQPGQPQPLGPQLLLHRGELLALGVEAGLQLLPGAPASTVMSPCEPVDPVRERADVAWSARARARL